MADVMVAVPAAKQVRAPFSSGARKWLVLIHLWLGLPIGLLLCLFTATGSVIVFRAEIEGAFEPKLAVDCKPAFDLDDATQQASAYASGAAITQINVPTAPGHPYQFVNGSTRVLVDGCSGHVVGTLNLAWLDWLVDLHRYLLAGKTGRNFTGIFGIALLTLALSGLTIWLLSNPSLRAAFTVKAKGPARRFVWELHRSVALGALAFLLISSVTGITLAFPDTFRLVLDRLAGAPQAEAKAPRRPRKAGRVELRSLAYYNAAVSSVIPGGLIREIRLPEAGTGPLQLRVWAPGDFRRSGNNRVTLDAQSSQIISVTKFADATASLKITQGATALHYAEWGGLTVQLLWCAAGLMPGVLFVSGAMTWWLRRKPPQRKTA